MSFLDKLEDQYKQHESIVKGIAGLALGTVVGMWAYGKYKESKSSKVIDKGLAIEKKFEALSQEIKDVKESVDNG